MSVKPSLTKNKSYSLCMTYTNVMLVAETFTKHIRLKRHMNPAYDHSSMVSMLLVSSVGSTSFSGLFMQLIKALMDSLRCDCLKNEDMGIVWDLVENKTEQFNQSIYKAL